MLRSGVLILALAVASNFALPHFQNRDGDRVRDLVSATVDYVRNTYSKMDPERMPDVKFDANRSHWEGLIKADLSLTNTIYSGLSNVITEKLETDPDHLTAQVVLNFPEVKLASDYQIEGEAVGQKVSGKGHFDIKTVNYTLSLSNLKLLEMENKALRIQSFGLSVDIADFPLAIDGLTVENMTVPAFEEFVDQSMLNQWNSIKSRYSRALEIAYVSMVNRAIGDRTLEEVIQWLKDHKQVNGAENFIAMLTMPEMA